MSDTIYTGITNSKVTIEGGGSGAGKYSLLERVRDDNGNEIGTVGTFFTDANGVEYAVVVLDTKDRLDNGKWTATANNVTDLPLLSTAITAFSNRDTATFNTQKILDWCIATSSTSSACEHCRTLSYVIDSIAYQGQLPNKNELFDLLKNYIAIDSADITASNNPTLTLSGLLTYDIWSSSQCTTSNAWLVTMTGSLATQGKTFMNGVVPVLEIPNR